MSDKIDHGVEQMSAKAVVFVYGTLKKGGRLSCHMSGQKFLGEAKTAPRYRLYNISWFPGLKEDEDEGKEIEGELYEVDEQCLANLDRVEGAPHLYSRSAVTIQNPPFNEGGKNLIQSYFYNGDISECSEVGTSWPIGG